MTHIAWGYPVVALGFPLFLIDSLIVKEKVDMIQPRFFEQSLMESFAALCANCFQDSTDKAQRRTPVRV
ncbi:MAG: hypothetical protein DRR19_14940 [Candidatus Parabeggiatoa sp. nov. 1]|nr:MAG: hypothetical protein DRR19_14940 [Gammaproteobacteria bacterium]